MVNIKGGKKIAPGIVYYSISFTIIGFANQATNLKTKTVLYYQLYYGIFCFMFLIDAIKPKVENKFKLFFHYCLGDGSWESTK